MTQPQAVGIGGGQLFAEQVETECLGKPQQDVWMCCAELVMAGMQTTLSSHNPDRVAAGKIGYDYCRNGKRNNVHVTWTVQEMITQQCLLMELAGGSEHSAMHCRIADVAERTV